MTAEKPARRLAATGLELQDAAIKSSMGVPTARSYLRMGKQPSERA